MPSKTGACSAAGLKKGDLLLEVDGEPFFNDSTVSELRAWLVRELDARPRKLALRVLRRGAELALDVTVSLEPGHDKYVYRKSEK